MPTGEALPDVGKAITGAPLTSGGTVDPITQAALLQAGSKLVGTALGGQPARSDASGAYIAPDFGGFNVSFGDNSPISASGKNQLLAIGACVVGGLVLLAVARKFMKG